MTQSKALVGPLKLLRFGPYPHEVRIAYAVPRDSMDPRYRLCFDHHTACDCREAALNETIREYQAGLRALKSAAQKLLSGHRVYDWGPRDNRLNLADGDLYYRYLNGDGPLACQCTGCQLLRASHEDIDTDENGVVL